MEDDYNRFKAQYDKDPDNEGVAYVFKQKTEMYEDAKAALKLAEETFVTGSDIQDAVNVLTAAINTLCGDAKLVIHKDVAWVLDSSDRLLTTNTEATVTYLGDSVADATMWSAKKYGK
jgi:hypothetical protein